MGRLSDLLGAAQLRLAGLPEWPQDEPFRASWVTELLTAVSDALRDLEVVWRTAASDEQNPLVAIECCDGASVALGSRSLLPVGALWLDDVRIDIVSREAEGAAGSMRRFRWDADPGVPLPMLPERVRIDLFVTSSGPLVQIGNTLIPRAAQPHDPSDGPISDSAWLVRLSVAAALIGLPLAIFGVMWWRERRRDTPDRGVPPSLTSKAESAEGRVEALEAGLQHLQEDVAHSIAEQSARAARHRTEFTASMLTLLADLDQRAGAQQRADSIGPRPSLEQEARTTFLACRELVRLAARVHDAFAQVARRGVNASPSIETCVLLADLPQELRIDHWKAMRGLAGVRLLDAAVLDWVLGEDVDPAVLLPALGEWDPGLVGDHRRFAYEWLKRRQQWLQIAVEVLPVESEPDLGNGLERALGELGAGVSSGQAQQSGNVIADTVHALANQLARSAKFEYYAVRCYRDTTATDAARYASQSDTKPQPSAFSQFLRQRHRDLPPYTIVRVRIPVLRVQEPGRFVWDARLEYLDEPKSVV